MLKKLNEMTELQDMGRFPTSVYLGATGNILFTIYLTWHLHRWWGGEVFVLLPWALLMPTLNIIPVLLLRKQEKPGREFPEISQMNFFKDQHRFSSWVYVVAAGNMFFWIVCSWWIFGLDSGKPGLLVAQGLALIVTFVPLWRPFHPSFKS